MLGLDNQANGNAPALDKDISEALSPGQPDRAIPVLRETVQAIQRDPVSATRQLLNGLGVHPMDLLSPHEQQALAGSPGGEIGAVIARHSDVFSRNGVSPAQGVHLLLAAQNLLERDPERGVRMLAQSYGVDLGGSEQGLAPIVEAFAQTKGQALTQEVRKEMARIVREPKFASEDIPALSVLQAAFTEAKRRLAGKVKRSLDQRMTETLEGTR